MFLQPWCLHLFHDDRRLLDSKWALETLVCIGHMHKWPCNSSFVFVADVLKTIHTHSGDPEVLQRGIACLRYILRAGPQVLVKVVICQC